MAAYCQVYGVIHFTSSAGWLPVYRDQLRAQRSVTSMGKLYLIVLAIVSRRLEQLEKRSATADNGSQLARCDVVSARCCRLAFI